MPTDTKAALLDAAKRLVREQGYSGTSVRDLATATGANVAAVSYHFGSREQLLNQALLDAFVEWADRLATVSPADADADADADAGSRLVTLARAVLDDIPAAQPLFAGFLEAVLQARRSPALRQQLAEHYAGQRTRVSELVSGGASGSGLPVAVKEVLASVLVAVVDGLLLQSLIDADAVPTGDQLSGFVGGPITTHATTSS